jgi:hypothetical protein
VGLEFRAEIDGDLNRLEDVNVINEVAQNLAAFVVVFLRITE